MQYKYQREWNMFMFWTAGLIRQIIPKQVQCSHYSGHLVSPHTRTQLRGFSDSCFYLDPAESAAHKNDLLCIYLALFMHGETSTSPLLCVWQPILRHIRKTQLAVRNKEL